MPQSAGSPQRPSGPEPERLKIEGDWEAAVDKALDKKPPEGGWPKPTPVPQRSPKKKAGTNKKGGKKP